MTEEKVASKKGQRVYEYTDQDGNVFWSFEKLPSVVTPSRTLRLGDRVGTPLEAYVGDLRALRRMLLEDPAEVPLEEEPGSSG